MWSKAIVWVLTALALTRAFHLNSNGINVAAETANKDTGPISRETESKEPLTEKDINTDSDGDNEPDSGDRVDPDCNIEPDPGGSIEPEPGGSIEPEPGGSIEPEPGGSIEPEPDTDPDTGESGQEETLEIVETDLGPVTAVNLHGSLGIKSYLDIPYGKFDKLFQSPSNPPRWLEHNILEHSKRCPQLQNSNIVVGETDCLTLSVFTPSNVINAPVLFHIYDGDFTIGSANPAIYGPEYLVPKGVILVLPNYRLGPLGFLCAPGSDVVPGNAALKDLTLALDWTKRNIEAFGGDPSNIIVSGDGIAGALVGYLTISPLSRDYIAKAIVESGSVLSHLAIDRNPEATSTFLATQLVAVSEGPKELEIFDRIDVNTLVRAANHTKYKPCIDTGVEAFLNATPWSILQETETNISFIIGTADNAGMHEALAYTASSIQQLNNNLSLFLPSDLEFESDDDKHYTSDRLKRLYFGELDITVRDREKLAVWHTDTSYLGPSIRVARQLVEAGATVYFYEFSFVGKLNRERNALTDPLHGAARRDIIGYVFCQDGVMPEPNSVEEHMVNTMTDLWVAFMKTGNPSALWSPLKKSAASEEEWLSVGQSGVTPKQGVHIQRLDTWVDLYDQYFVDRNHAIRVQDTLVAVAIIMTSLGRFF